MVFATNLATATAAPATIGTLTIQRNRTFKPQADAIADNELLILTAMKYDNPRLAESEDFSIKGWRQVLTRDAVEVVDDGERVEISSNEKGIMDVINSFKNYGVNFNVLDNEIWAELAVIPEIQVAFERNKGYDPGEEYGESVRKFLLYATSDRTGYGFEMVVGNMSGENVSNDNEQTLFPLETRALVTPIYNEQKVIKYKGRF